MTVREIKQRPGSSKLGTASRSASGKGKRRIIDRLIVHSDVVEHGRNVGVRVDVEGKVFAVLSLGPNAAVELVKGLLLNLPDHFLAADEELLGIFAQAQSRSDAEAKAVVSALNR